MKIGSTGLAADLSRLLLRPVSTPVQPDRAEAQRGDLQAAALPQQQLLASLQHGGAIGRLTQNERQRAYRAMEDLSRQLLDGSDAESIDLSL